MKVGGCVQGRVVGMNGRRDGLPNLTGSVSQPYTQANHSPPSTCLATGTLWVKGMFESLGCVTAGGGGGGVCLGIRRLWAKCWLWSDWTWWAEGPASITEVGGR